MYYVDPNAQNGQGSLRNVGTMPSDGPSGWTSTEAMFAPGRILRTGGGSNSLPEEGGTQTAAKNAAAVIDINGATPTYKKMPSMPVALHWASATVLADGNVVVTGGSQTDNQLVGVNTQALIWKAGTGGWTRGAQGSGRARLYHSIALLLPDGSVLVAGGGAPGPQTNRNAEIYYPYYLFELRGRVRAQAEDHGHLDEQPYLGRELHAVRRLGRGDPARDARQDGLGDAQLQFRAALHGAAVHRRRPAAGCR